MKTVRFVLFSVILTIFGSTASYSQGLKDYLGGRTLGSVLGNALEGVFTSSNLTPEDLAGEWKSDGPAVCFKGEGFLKQAGGLAAAGMIEEKLKPYYEQYGLTGATLTVDKDAKFTLKCKLATLSGTITPKEGEEKGVFDFNFMFAGKVKLMSVPAYVQKTSRTMEVMFDATKFKQLLSALTKFVKIPALTTVGGLLDSYDGLCVGLHLNLEKEAAKSNGTGTGSKPSEAESNDNNEKSPSENTGKSDTGSKIGKGISILRNILTGNSNSK